MKRKAWNLTCSTCAAASLGLSWFTWPKQDQPSSSPEVRHVQNQLDWIKLAFEGSDLLQYYQPSRDWSKDQQEQQSEEDIYLLLHQLEIDSGGTWQKCQEALLATTSSSNSNYDRLVKLLSMLLYKSEFDVCEKLLQQDILHILYCLLTTSHYQPSNKAIPLLSLKILSNLAENCKQAAQQISESSLLPLLATMINHPVNEEEAVLAHKVMVNMLYSLQMGSYKLSPDLYELYSPPLDQSPLLDVVFVHGLRGNAFRTWRQKERPGKKTTLFWPREWLPGDLSSPIRIIAIDYSSRFFRFGAMLDTIESRSKRFQSQFTQAGVGKRPLVFICHSMGGLLVKHLLVDNEELRSKTIGVLFMATPHRGSPIASSLSYSLLRPSDDVRLLTEESEVNRELHANFSQVMHQIPLFVTILESKKTKVLGKWRLVVPWDSAVFGLGSVYHVDTHHHGVCKPEDRESASYRIVLNFLRDALRLA
uniref:Protein SERAC1 n=1 Tax=Ditylenchus dipsaci TaxID=166011 RepID=A0A915D611_9BILA